MSLSSILNFYYKNSFITYFYNQLFPSKTQTHGDGVVRYVAVIFFQQKGYNNFRDVSQDHVCYKNRFLNLKIRETNFAIDRLKDGVDRGKHNILSDLRNKSSFQPLSRLCCS